MKSKPLIGLTVTRGRDKDHPKNRHYVRCLEAAGAEVIVLPPEIDAAPYEIITRIDGLVLGGGGDVHPRRYGAPINGTYVDSIDEERDVLEIELIRLALERNMPILGICRGIQVLNVAMGGGLLQHIPDHGRHESHDVRTHKVRVRRGSLLWQALGELEELIVNTYHHQVVTRDVLAPSLLASAWLESDEHIIEGVESINHRWVIGVQWHPERVDDFPPPYQEAQRRLFRSLVRAAVGAPVMA